MDDKSLARTTGSELVRLADRFPIMSPETNAEIQRTIAANIGPNGLAEGDLEKIKVPSGGGTAWSVPTIDGEEPFKELSGIVVAWRDARLYWRTGFAEQGKKRTPPDCSSKDGQWGVGDPGGACDSCPLAQYGSDPKGGRGQACKQVRQLLFLRDDQILPNIINVPPTSLKNAKQYFLRLASARIPYFSVVTKMRLERTANADGTDYARILFATGDRLNSEERELMEPFASQMDAILHPLAVDVASYTPVEEESSENENL
jgi:hypothetical protein